jgi:carbon monoxide dehydrogenase subunit G
MEIATSFRLGVPPEQAWPVLTDLGRVAPCMPGVQVESADDDGLQAKMRVKVGPVIAAYRTQIVLESKDDEARTAVLRASGRETRGPGTVEALVTAELRGDGEGTAVDLKTDFTVTGKVAQFGGGVMTEVADRLLQQFATNLEQDLTAAPAVAEPAAAPAADGSAQPQTSAPPPPQAEPEPVDLGRIAGQALAPRLTLAAGVLALVLAVLIALRSRPA